MESEREFARRRFAVVKGRLEDPAAKIERLDRIQLERECRLLGKVLDEVVVIARRLSENYRAAPPAAERFLSTKQTIGDQDE